MTNEVVGRARRFHVWQFRQARGSCSPRAATVAGEKLMTQILKFQRGDLVAELEVESLEEWASLPSNEQCRIVDVAFSNAGATIHYEKQEPVLITKGSQTVKKVEMTPEEWAALQAAPARVVELEKQLAEEKATTKALAASIAKHNPSAFDEPVDKTVAMEALEKGLTSFCKSKGITKNLWTDGLAAFRETDEGRALSDDVNGAE